MTMPGLMQPRQLLVSSILAYAAAAHPTREIVGRAIEEPLWRYDFAAFARRCGRAARALRRLGIGPGDRVSSLGWNTHRHLELFFAVPGLGAVLHTANPRLFDEQLIYTINHAGSSILLFDRNLLESVQRIAPRLTGIATFVSLTADALADAHGCDVTGYEALLADEADGFEWEQFGEDAAAFLCYTSGTTGDPKGVLYSHRAVVLHAMAGGLASAFGLTAFDVVMPCSSLYHATAWGLPFVALLAGSKLVLPGDRMDGASLHELIEGEQVTFTGGVPTIWTMYLAPLASTGRSPGALRRVVIAGSAVPRDMAETFKRRFGVDTLQFWGMTETCPIGVVATPTPALMARGEEAAREVIWTHQGRLQFGLEMRVAGEDGSEAPHDGRTPGALMVRGPWTIQRYFRHDEDAVGEDGWFDTGDIATLDELGYMRITDRVKDVIKSGGEWISSIDLENAAAGCPGVKVAAVIGIPDPQWEERPLLIVETHDGHTLTDADVIGFLTPRVAKWWLPKTVLFDTVPLTATGKIDKKTLRARHAAPPAAQADAAES